jgi:S1-C subfamily serine protease/HEAT repeat protein
VAEPRVTCPGCQAGYRLKVEPQPGARLRCPKCGATINLRPAMAVVSAERAAVPTAAYAPSSGAWIVPASVAAALVALLLWGSFATYLLLRDNSHSRPIVAEAVPAAESAIAPAPQPTPPAAEAEPAPQEHPAPATAAAASATPTTSDPVADEVSTTELAEAAAVIPVPVAGPPIAAPATALASGSNALRYEWRKGDIRSYDIKLVAEFGDAVQTTTGGATLRVSPWNEPVAAAIATDEDADAGPDWTGTAFVVHSDGYLVTCAHVVNGAEELIVRLNGGAYKAIVVASDDDHDVALIRINARSLKSLPLADDRGVELGEAIRVLGYPYSDVLGASLKVSQGIVSGVIDEDGNREFQIDAALNHGNSGGPVLNERGEVIGVASSGLKDDHAEGVGFAAPIATVASLLTAERLAAVPVPITPANGDALAGPALIARASKSLALVEGRRQRAPEAGPPIEFTAFAGSTVSTQSRGAFGVGATTRFGDVPGHFRSFGTIRIDAFGETIDESPEPQSPQRSLGLVQLVIEQLDPQGRSSWVNEREVEIATPSRTRGPWESIFPTGGITHGPSPFDGQFGGARFGPPRPSFGPFGLEEPPVFAFLSASIRNAYRIAERRPDGKVVVERTYALEAAGDRDNPDARVAGSGRFVFDPQLGCIESMDFKQTMTISQQNVDVSIPMSYAFKLATPQEFIQNHPTSAARLVKSQQYRRARDSRPGAVGIPEKQIDELLAEIGRQISAGDHPVSELNELGDLPVVSSRQAKVCRVLLLLVSGGHDFEETSALLALQRWAESSCVLPLIKLLDGGEDFRRGQIAEILGKLRDPRAAQPLAKLMAEDNFGFRYAQALESLGPAAEKAVLPLLKHKDEDVRRTACDVLEKVGTRQSLPALEALLKESNDGNSLASHSIERAIEEIRGREAGQAVRNEIGGAGGIVPLADERVGGSAIDRAIATLTRSRADGSAEADALRTLAEMLPPSEATRAKVAKLILSRLERGTDAFARSSALDALPQWVGPEHEGKLLALLASGDEGLRPGIYAALGATRGEKSGHALLAELDQHHDDKQLAPKIADALALAGESVRNELLARLASQDLLVRAMAARALAGIPGEDVDAALQRVLDNEKVNIALEEAVSAIASRQARQ